MDKALIGIVIFLAIVLGVGGAFLLILIKKKLHRKRLLKEIEKNRLKFTVNGKPLDIIKKEIEKEEKVEKKKVKKVRVKKVKVKKKKK